MSIGFDSDSGATCDKALEALHRRLWEERRSALRTFTESVVAQQTRANGVCGSCDEWLLLTVEIEAAAEYRRGLLRGLEIAISIVQGDGAP